jgi:hypothetical protein
MLLPVICQALQGIAGWPERAEWAATYNYDRLRLDRQGEPEDWQPVEDYDAYLATDTLHIVGTFERHVNGAHHGNYHSRAIRRDLPRYTAPRPLRLEVYAVSSEKPLLVGFWYAHRSQASTSTGRGFRGVEHPWAWRAFPEDDNAAHHFSLHTSKQSLVYPPVRGDTEQTASAFEGRTSSWLKQGVHPDDREVDPLDNGWRVKVPAKYSDDVHIANAGGDGRYYLSFVEAELRDLIGIGTRARDAFLARVEWQRAASVSSDFPFRGFSC